MLLCCCLFVLASVAGAEHHKLLNHNDDGPHASWLEDGGEEVLVQGSWMTTKNNNTFASFQGIPYASPPVGDKRFMRPEEFKYNKTLTNIDASGTFNTACPQPGGNLPKTLMSEDCLYLNVYTFDGEDYLRPVMVFIHGGSFTSGDGTWGNLGPQYFIDEEVILVTFNYRLGALGFLSLGNEIIPGNMGLWDQQAALRWVQEHILSFGGDPDNVTVFGESAGSWSVLYHLVSQQSQGLFQKIIGESGSPLSSAWGFIPAETAITNGEIFADKVECALDDLECFQSLPVELLLSLNMYLDDPTDFPAFVVGNPWNGVVDRDFTDNPFLSDTPDKILKKGEFNKDVEIILGANQDEGLLDIVILYLFPVFYSELSSDWDHCGPISLLGRSGLGDISEEDIILSNKILEFYIGSVDNFTSDNFQAITDMKTDATFWHGINQAVTLISGHGVPVYQYIFSYRGLHSLLDFFGVQPGTFGVCHGDELFYLFDPISHLDMSDLPSEDQHIRSLLISSWTNFAKYGDPSPPGSNFLWTPVGADNGKYLNISGTDPTMERSDEYSNRMEFWSALFS